MSAFPEKLRRTFDLGWKALVHRAVQRSVFEHLSMGRSGRQRNVDFRWQANNPARCVLRHFFLHRNGHPAKIDAKFLGFYAHRRTDAGPKRGRDKVRRRKRCAFSLIVCRRIRWDFRLGRPVRRIAMQITRVLDRNSDHAKVCRADLSCAIPIAVIPNESEGSPASSLITPGNIV